jgi:hypothetical protein
MSSDGSRKPRLTVDRDAARALLDAQIRRGREIANEQIRTPDGLHRAEAERCSWFSNNSAVLTKLFDTHQVVDGFHKSFVRVSVPGGFSEFVASFRKTVEGEIAQLESVVEKLDLYEEPSPEIPSVAETTGDITAGSTRVGAIERICARFHVVARRLAERETARNTFAVKNESDVQHLFHALLHLEFDDIRLEECIPSYARKAPRMDFLLPEERLAVVVKKTRKGLGPKKLSAQLTEDIARYETHPDCASLLCFVYDPDGHIKDARELEQEFGAGRGELGVRVVVGPGAA